MALNILRDLDSPLRDNMLKFRLRMSPGIPVMNLKHRPSEAEYYTLWRHQFDVSKSWYSDELIRRLLKIAGPDANLDGVGRAVSWRVRRLGDIHVKEIQEDARPSNSAEEPQQSTSTNSRGGFPSTSAEVF